MASGFYIKHPHVISRNMYSVHFLAKILDRLLVWLVGLDVGVLDDVNEFIFEGSITNE